MLLFESLVMDPEKTKRLTLADRCCTLSGNFTLSSSLDRRTYKIETVEIPFKETFN